MADLIQDHLFRKLEDPDNDLWKKIDMYTAESFGLFSRQQERENEYLFK